MQKILLASTALVLSAGFAAAEVTVGGDGRMGVVYTEGGDLLIDPGLDGIIGTADDIVITPAGNEYSFSSRIRISFSASGETDGGLQFGGSIRADNSGNGTNGTAGSVFVSGAFGKLSMGDVDSGGKAAVGQVSGVGYTGLGDLNEITYLSTPVDEAVLYEYAFGDATIYASVDQINNDEDAYSVGVNYTFGTYTFALGYEVVDDLGDHVIAGVAAGFGDITVKAVYGDFQADTGGPLGDFDQYAVSVDYAMGPLVVTGFVQSDDFDGLADDEDMNYGLGASYDLGGGAALKGGIAHDGDAIGDQDVVADFGITMSF
ncbi:MAG: porin [Hasllibacter sp.]